MSIAECPKCHYRPQATDALHNPDICPACGIVYYKWLARQQALDPAENTPTEILVYPANTLRDRVKTFITYVPEKINPATFWARVVTLAAFALWGGYFITAGVNWELIGGSFMHNINLPFHEFGHVLFSFFGRFMAILGGSLFQVLLPLGLMLAFIIKQRDNFGGSIMLWWCGQSFIDLAPYIADAKYRTMPLIMGMGEESHDWGNLLTMMNLVDSAKTLGNISFSIGSLVIIIAIAWGGFILRLQKKNLLSD